MREHVKLFILIAGVAILLFIFSNQGKPKPVEEQKVPIGFTTYQDENVMFDYPETLESRPIDDGRILIGDAGTLKRDSFFFKVYEQSTSFRSFEPFVENEKAQLVEYAKNFDAVEGEDYTFEVTEYNGLPVFIYSRSFGGMVGNILDMYVWMGRGKVYKFTSEGDHDRLMQIYRTIRPAS